MRGSCLENPSTSIKPSEPGQPCPTASHVERGKQIETSYKSLSLQGCCVGYLQHTQAVLQAQGLGGLLVALGQAQENIPEACRAAWCQGQWDRGGSTGTTRDLITLHTRRQRASPKRVPPGPGCSIPEEPFPVASPGGGILLEPLCPFPASSMPGPRYQPQRSRAQGGARVRRVCVPTRSTSIW